MNYLKFKVSRFLWLSVYILKEYYSVVKVYGWALGGVRTPWTPPLSTPLWVSVFRIPTPTRTCAANPRRKIHGRIRINTLYRSEINRTRFRQIFSQSALRTISSTFNKREIVFIVGWKRTTFVVCTFSPHFYPISVQNVVLFPNIFVMFVW
jgi:hypothetical protein